MSPLFLFKFFLQVKFFSYEKMISGKYLGEIVRHALLKLVKAKVLFGGKSSEILDKFEGFESYFLSVIEEG